MAQQHPSPTPASPTPARHDEDEIIHVPTRHRARWVMGILLLFMILTTFTVGDEVVKLMTGQGRSSAFATWHHPVEGEISITYDEWQSEANALRKVYSMMGLDLRDDAAKETVASTMLFSTLGERAGIAFTDSELRTFVTNRFGGGQNYRALLPRYGLTPTECERTLRKALIAERYRTLLTGAWGTPDIEELQKSWRARHQEYSFDYVELTLEKVLEEVKATPLTDEELQAYFDGLPQPKKDGFKTAEKLAAEVVGLPYAGASTDALFAKFPKATDETELEAKANSYYQGFAFRRFRNPAPTSQADFVKPYESVKAEAREGALAYEALSSWLKTLTEREAKGETIDLAAEAAALGLSYQKIEPAVDQDAWVASTAGGWVSGETPGMIFGNEQAAVPGKLYTAVIVDDKAHTLARVLAREPAVMPAFAEIRDKLRDEVWSNKAKDLAKSKLEALRDQLGTRPPAVEGQPPPSYLPVADEARFYEVARAAGLEARLRDFKERVPPPGETLEPFDQWARTQTALYTEKPGTVIPAGTDFEGKHAFLARVRALRDPDVARMKPSEFASVEQELRNTALQDFRVKAFSLAALETRFGLKFSESGR